MDALKVGYCATSMREWWLLRNPFRSIHAAALLNMGEATGGLAVLTWCEANGFRAIVNRLEIDFMKKARGKLTAVSQVKDTDMPAKEQSKTAEVVTDIFDASGTVVAQTTAFWTISPIKKKAE